MNDDAMALLQAAEPPDRHRGVPTYGDWRGATWRRSPRAFDEILDEHYLTYRIRSVLVPGRRG